MPAENLSPRDATGVPTRARERAPLGALGGVPDVLGAQRPAAHLPATCAEEMHRPYPSGAPEGNSNIRSHADRETVGE